MLLAGRFLVSAEWPDGVDGRYYWEHCFWVDSDDFDNNFQMNLAVLADMRLLYTEQVRMDSCRWYHLGTTVIYFSNNYGLSTFGQQPEQANYNLLICARWRMRGEDGSYSYHLHRQPIGEDYLVDGVWSDEGYLQSQTRLNTFIGQGIYRTNSGALIDAGEVAQLPVMWQLRHGTKRRKSRFWLPV